MQSTLRALDPALVEADARGWKATDEAVARVLPSADRAEGVSALLERRPPGFPRR